MAIQAKALGIAAAVVVGTAFALCALAIAIDSTATMNFFCWFFHMNLSSIAGHVTIGSFVGGVAVFSAYVGLIVGLTGIVYNRLATRGQ